MTRAALVAALAGLALAVMPAAAGETAQSLHAYYLFLTGEPSSCEDCYLPLVAVRHTLEDIAAAGRDTTVVLITTYKRDSIWQVERDVPLVAADVSAGERIVRLRGRRYRYQAIPPAEALRLLKDPEGSIPVHRPRPVPDARSLEDPISAFGGP